MKANESPCEDEICNSRQPASSILAVAGSIRDRLDGGNRFDSWAVAVYGIVLLLAAIAYFILTRALISLHGESSTLATSIGRDRKGKISIAIYAAAIPLAFAKPWIAGSCYVIVAIMWLIPDPRIERRMERRPT